MSQAHATPLDCQNEPSRPPQMLKPDTLDYAQFLGERGRFYNQCRMDYARAKQDFTESYAIASSVIPPLPGEAGIALSNLARLYMEWNQHLDQVEDKFKQAAKLLQGTPRYFEALTHLADFHAQQGKRKLNMPLHWANPLPLR